ncbi:response regulator transcription factor [Octadecabacter sp. 1_MG-2023]|uniref:response regulator transcription factor n=1 Tax=unclassified Octadecabacter TaxID=196158 RepID=UPI001C0871C0|nr:MULTISPECIES: response regulator transcription factor [unclassified Octadecabacter]MBU2994379.1 response regulator transcription factor [Octadecabacter sp. B2R22]MDO6734330.1 response regulator transcription factor [Octadecabacter sp. 1_MG-2023]
MSGTVLIVDDDADIRDVVRIALSQAGFQTQEAGDGRAALAAIAAVKPDLVVLDIGLPEMDGLEVCRTVRVTSDVPILFLTAQGDEIDRIVGLEMGADDYLSKPFSPRELVARVKAILRRGGTVVEDQPLRHGIIEVDPNRHLTRVRGEAVALTAREMDLLVKLIARPDQVFARPALVDAIYGTNVHVSDRTMDSHLRNLRAKLSAAGCADAVETMHGIGIRMGPCKGAAP